MRVVTQPALLFCNALGLISSVSAGAGTGQQVIENALFMATKISNAYGEALKREGLIAGRAPTSA